MNDAQRAHLQDTCDPLDASSIQAALRADAALAACWPDPIVEVAASIDSTNSALLARAEALRLPHALLAECQRAGRGRRGRAWISHPGSSLCFSLAWHCRRALRESAGLSIVAGVALADALRALGVPVALKWPNDLVCAGAKLGGILVEVRPLQDGLCAVVGVGINVRAVPGLAEVDVAATDLEQLLGAALPTRNALAAMLLARLAGALQDFDTHGLAPVHGQWARHDVLQDRLVTVLGPQGARLGTARGIDADGALRVDFPEGAESVHSGEVSVRA